MQIYLEPCQTSKIEKPLTNLAKSSILDVWLGSDYNFISYNEQGFKYTSERTNISVKKQPIILVTYASNLDANNLASSVTRKQ